MYTGGQEPASKGRLGMSASSSGTLKLQKKNKTKMKTPTETQKHITCTVCEVAIQLPFAL